MKCDCCGSGQWRYLFSEKGIRLGQCPECDLLSIADLPQPELRMTEMEAGHYAGSKRVLAADRQHAAERVLEAQFQRYVELANGFVPSGRWLDIGCGAGLLLSLASQAGYRGEGIELTADRRAAAAANTGLPIHGQPVEELAFATGSFDVISLVNVLSHLTSPMRTLSELRRVLAPGGVIVVVTGELTAGVHRSDMLTWNLGDHLYFLGDRTMGRYAAALGFDIVHHDRRWLPDELYSRDWLRMKGRSPLKNAAKSALLHTPGAFPAFRAAMLRRQRDSAAHTSVFALRPGGG